MASFLTESALLAHGLVSIDGDTLLESWPPDLENIVWVDSGKICTGNMERFLPFRRRAEGLLRIDWERLPAALREGASGALTASGTMAVCRMMGLPLAVSCGIGGIGDIKAESLCPDLPALRAIPVTLLATSFKDMLDISASASWLMERGVAIYGVDCKSCTGYLFQSADVPISAVFAGRLPEPPGGLILNPIPAKKRIDNIRLLAVGIAAGKRAEADGQYYHPAANAAFDRATGGRSSRIQLESLVENVLLADRLTRGTIRAGGLPQRQSNENVSRSSERP